MTAPVTARPEHGSRKRVRRRRVAGLWTAVGVAALAVALLAVGAVVGAPDDAPGAPSAGRVAGPAAPGAAFGTAIASLQDGLRRLPANDRAWAQLGAAYVQQARLTADPSLYAKADGAFAESLRLRPTGNDAALAGQAGLAASRHQFARAVELSQAALSINAYSSAALAVQVDGLVELGRYEQSRVVLERFLQLRPGVDAFTRASYAKELQGDVDGARDALERALAVAATPSDRAFAHHYLGELAWNNGDVQTASDAYEAALAADPSYVPSLAARGKVKALRGDVEGALADYRAAIARQPQVATLVELGELLQAQGNTAQAAEQYALVRATQQLYAASGQVVDAELALFEADHGDPAKAVELAGRAHAARPDSIVAQDAYAWALHAAGRDAQALPLARAALRTGLPSAAFRYHLGAIEAALGDPAARADLQAALALNPGWNPLQPPRARELLAKLP